MLETLRSDLVHALRRLRRAPVAATVAVSTLSLGIGATTAIFTVVDTVLLRPLAYEEPDRLVAAFTDETTRGDRRSPTSPADFLEWKRGSRALELLTAAHPWSPVLRGRGHPEELRALKATTDLFDLLGVEPALGRTFDDPGDELQVVLGYALWQRRFGGDPAIVGQALALDGQSYEVVAVMPRGFQFPPFWAEADLWAPLVFDAEQEASHARFLRVFGRLRPGATLEQARAEMDVIGARLAREWSRWNADVRVNVEPLIEPVVSRARPALLILLGAVTLVLLIACANVASVLLAEGFAREREAAVRAALGASRGGLVRMRLVESVALSLVGGACGLLLARLAVSALPRLGPVGLPRVEEVALDGRVAVFALVLSLLSGIMAGLLPALRTSRFDLVPSLRRGERATGDRGRHPLHDGLVVGEVAMAVVLLVGAGLLVKSFLHLQQPDVGFESRGLATVTVSFSGSPRGEPGRRATFLGELTEAALAVPGVERAAFVNHVPIGGDTWRTHFSVEGRSAAPDPSQVPQAVMRTVTPGYAAAMGMPLLRGRDFADADRADTSPVVLVNQSLARRYWADGDPVGDRIKLGRVDSDTPWRTIVGVVGDARQASPLEAIGPEILFPYTQDPVEWYERSTLVVYTDSDPRGRAEEVVGRLRTVAPDVPISRVETMPELLAAALSQERLGALLMACLSAVALALAMGGIYGVMAYAVGRRTHEIGVRLSLGARPGQVQALFLREGLKLGLTGAALGLLVALGVSRVLQGQLHDVSPTDPATFAGVGILLLASAALGALVPARRAARLDPATVLRDV